MEERLLAAIRAAGVGSGRVEGDDFIPLTGDDRDAVAPAEGSSDFGL
jgi:hypothetical protein